MERVHICSPKIKGTRPYLSKRPYQFKIEWTKS